MTCHNEHANKRMRSGLSEMADRTAISWSRNQRTSVKVEHWWTIDQFTFQRNKVIYSPIFDDQTEDKIRWRLELFPKGSSRDCEGYLCLFLKLCNPKEEGHLFVKYRLTLMNSTESTIAMKDWHSTTFNKEHSSSGKLKFVALDLVHSSVINSGNNSVISDQLKVKCEILYEVQQNPVYGYIPLQTPSRNAPGSLISNFEDMLRTRQLTDVVIEVQDKKFPAHKVVLAARSPVFLGMFENNLLEQQTNTIKIEDIEPRVFAEVLRFLYTDEVEKLDEMADKLLAAADKYILDLLKDKCEAYLSGQITLNSCCKMLILADRYSALDLKKIALDFIRCKSVEVYKTDGWKSFFQSAPPQLLQNIFEICMTAGPSTAFNLFSDEFLYSTW